MSRQFDVIVVGGIGSDGYRQLMFRPVRVALLLLFVHSPAFSLPGSAEIYIGREWDQTLDMTVTKTRVRKSYAVQIGTHRRNRCSGKVGGRGLLYGRRLIFSPDDENLLLSLSSSSDSCRPCQIKILFNSELKKAKIQEESCGFYHGATCNFSGSVKRISRKIQIAK